MHARLIGIFLFSLSFVLSSGNCCAKDGIVKVRLSKSGLLRVTGDSEANQIHLELGENGQAVLMGMMGTEFEWDDSIDDIVELVGVERVRIRLLSGNDRVSIHANSDALLTSLYVHAGNDNDVIELDDVCVERSYTINGGGDDDMIFANLNHALIGRQPKFIGGSGYDEKMGNAVGKEVSMEASGLVPMLSRIDPDHNTSFIADKLAAGKTVHVPAGVWPVRPLSLVDHSRIVGVGAGVSELRLKIDVPPGRFDDQHVLATEISDVANGFTKDVYVAHLTLNGNYQQIDWSNVYNDGNGHGLYVRGAEDSLFENLEIKNLWTDGIVVATVLGQDNNSRGIDFRNITIHHAGRQGVSVVGGEDLTFDNFDVSSIGRDADLHTSPRSAIDLEPEPNAQRFVRNISITNWDIRRVGQGVLLTGTGSSLPAENITVRNITCQDLDGPQILSATDVSNLVVDNFHGQDHNTIGGVGVRFRNAVGTVDDLSVTNLQGTNYPLQIDRDSDMELTNIVVENTGRSVMQIGGEPSQAAQNTNVKLNGFLFRNVGNTAGLPVVRVKSAGYVEMVDGVISQVGVAPFTMSLYTDTYFSGCAFASGQISILTPGLDGAPIGQSF